jgi:hypothetical protein
MGILEDAGNAGLGTLDFLDTILDPLGRFVRTGLGTAIEGDFDLGRSWDSIWDKSKAYSGTDVRKAIGLESFGDDDGKFQVGDLADFALDTAIEVGTDPLTYLGIGLLSKGGKTIANAGRQASKYLAQTGIDNAGVANRAFNKATGLNLNLEDFNERISQGTPGLSNTLGDQLRRGERSLLSFAGYDILGKAAAPIADRIGSSLEVAKEGLRDTFLGRAATKTRNFLDLFRNRSYGSVVGEAMRNGDTAAGHIAAAVDQKLTSAENSLNKMGFHDYHPIRQAVRDYLMSDGKSGLSEMLAGAEKSIKALPPAQQAKVFSIIEDIKGIPQYLLQHQIEAGAQGVFSKNVQVLDRIKTLEGKLTDKQDVLREIQERYDENLSAARNAVASEVIAQQLREEKILKRSLSNAQKELAGVSKEVDRYHSKDARRFKAVFKKSIRGVEGDLLDEDEVLRKLGLEGAKSGAVGAKAQSLASDLADSRLRRTMEATGETGKRIQDLTKMLEERGLGEQARLLAQAPPKVAAKALGTLANMAERMRASVESVPLSIADDIELHKLELLGLQRTLDDLLKGGTPKVAGVGPDRVMQDLLGRERGLSEEVNDLLARKPMPPGGQTYEQLSRDLADVVKANEPDAKKIRELQEKIGDAKAKIAHMEAYYQKIPNDLARMLSTDAKEAFERAAGSGDRIALVKALQQSFMDGDRIPLTPEKIESKAAELAKSGGGFKELGGTIPKKYSLASIASAVLRGDSSRLKQIKDRAHILDPDPILAMQHAKREAVRSIQAAKRGQSILNLFGVEVARVDDYVRAGRITADQAEVIKKRGVPEGWVDGSALASELGYKVPLTNYRKDEWLVPATIADEARRFNRSVLNGEAIATMFRPMQAMTSIWKTIQTTVPGFHIRNQIGNKVNRALQGGLLGVQDEIKITKAMTGFIVNSLVHSEKAALEHAANITFDVPNGKLSLAQLIETMDEHGMRGMGQVAAELPSGKRHGIMRDIGAALTRSGKAGHALRVGVDTAKEFSKHFEDIDRAAMLLARIQKGDSISEAVFNTESALYNYRNVSPAVDFARRTGIAPFAAWSALNIPRMLEISLRRPGTFAALLKAKSVIENWSGGATEDELPRYLKNQLGVVMQRGKDGTSLYMPATGLIPLADLPTLADPGAFLAGMLGPVPEAAANLVFNWDTFTKSDIKKFDGHFDIANVPGTELSFEIDPRVKTALESLTGRLASGVAAIGEAKDGEDFIKRISSGLTGFQMDPLAERAGLAPIGKVIGTREDRRSNAFAIRSELSAIKRLIAKWKEAGRPDVVKRLEKERELREMRLLKIGDPDRYLSRKG